MDSTNFPLVAMMRLSCQECCRDSDDEARGWRTYVADDPDELDAEPVVASYCPDCAEHEFGPIRARRSSA
jgi:hypothetical protein